jgi:hypothetical protein
MARPKHERPNVPVLLLSSVLLVMFICSFALFDYRSILILYTVNALLQWWFSKFASETEDNASIGTGWRALARLLLILIPFFYVIGSLAMGATCFLYLFTQLL